MKQKSSVSESGREREDSLRYEVKMACREVSYERILMSLRLNRALLRPLYPTRRVQSIYLDTVFNRALEENLAGISRRIKTRFRWYGDGTERVSGHLERKHRENMLGWKQNSPTLAPLSVEGRDHMGFMRDLIAASPPRWQRYLEADGLQPAQWISYLRDYFSTADGHVRITVDRELQTFDQRIGCVLSSARPTPIPRVLVVEAKCAPGHYRDACRVLSNLPLFVDRCSKFVLASDREHGPIASVTRI